MVKQAGADTTDGERHAATRFVATRRPDHPHLTCIVTEDRLSSNASHIETLQAHDLRSRLGVTEGEYAYRFRCTRQRKPGA